MDRFKKQGVTPTLRKVVVIGFLLAVLSAIMAFLKKWKGNTPSIDDS